MSLDAVAVDGHGLAVVDDSADGGVEHNPVAEPLGGALRDQL